MMTFPKPAGVRTAAPERSCAIDGISMRIALQNRSGRFGWRASLALALAFVSASAACAQDDDAAALSAAVAAERLRPPAPRFSRAEFLARPELLGAWLSPDGRRIAYLRDDGRTRSVWRLSTAGGAPISLLPQTDATELAWSRDGRWLFLLTPRQLFALAADGQAGSRAIARLDGRWTRSFEGVDPATPDAAIVLESPPLVSRLPKRWRLFRIDARGRETLLHDSAREIIGSVFDARGRLAFVTYADGDRYTIERLDAPGGVGGTGHAVLRCMNLARCSLLAATPQPLLRTDVDSTFSRLAVLQPDGRLRTLHADPRDEADLDEVVLDPATRQPLIASYRSTIAANYGLTADAKRHVDAIERRYPARNLRIEVGVGPRARWLVHERDGALKGERLHLYDPASGTFRDVPLAPGFRFDGRVVARLPDAAMARKIAFAYRASDGLRLHGFVLVPPGVDPARAPLVANVHGGPFNQSRPEFSAQSQLLANRGYVVFEPNFRGSTGHGRAYLFAGHGDFGNGRVQRDIVDGVRYLIAHGVGDGTRVGIVGASFGGYSALQGVTFQPELFRVAIAAVPPADFGWVLRAYARSQDQFSRGIPLSLTMRLLSLDPSDPAIAERLRAQSPIANADALRRPVLLLAGGDDERVPIRSVTHYAAALKTRGNDVSLYIDAEGSHNLPSPQTREAYLYLMEAMLHRRLGGAAPSPPDARLRATLRKNLLLTGASLRGAATAD